MRWRSVEETDAQGVWLGLDLRREATANTASRPRSFLVDRCLWLEKQAARPGSALRKVIDGLSEPHIPAGWGLLGWFLALAAGWLLTVVGHDKVINLLALPLMAILAWNTVVMLAALVLEFCNDAGEVPWWVSRLHSRDKEGGDELERRLHDHYRALAWPLAMMRLKARARAWLHVAAAVLALGSIAGMYVKGWAREYRAVWESTLLGDQGTETFFRVVYGPASAVFNVRIPLEDVRPMHRTIVRETQPSEALPWIHLYAGTLVLFVIAPRLLLAGLALARCRQRIEWQWSKLDWPGCEARLRRTIEGGGEQVTILIHGWRAGDEPRERWCAAVRERLGGQAKLELATVPPGDEDEFVAGWQPANPSVVIVFNAAATPEVEVQGSLVGALRKRLLEAVAGARLIALVDAVTLRERRSGEQLASRLKLWEDTLKPGADVVQVL